MIATEQTDPFADLIARDLVRPVDPRQQQTIQARTLRPVSVNGLAEAVLRANRAGVPFMFLGKATAVAQTPPGFHQRHRSLPTTAFSLTLLQRVIEYRPMDFTITVEAGMPAGELRRILATRGQSLPLDTPHIELSTVGGMLASARTGPRRRSIGRLRDRLLGAQLVLADGTLVENGGRSLRQAHGYDLARLFVGSHGLLGAYTTVTLRTSPSSEARRCAIITLPAGTRERAVASIENLVIEPTAALLIDGFTRELPGWEGPGGRLLLFFEGNEATIGRATRHLRSLLGAIGVSETRLFDRDADALLDQVLDAPYHHGQRESVATLRLHGGHIDALALRHRIERCTAEMGINAELITDLHNNDVITRVRAIGPRALEVSARELFVRLAGEASHTALLEAPASFRQRFDATIQLPPQREHLIRMLRQTFDPHNLCAVDRSSITE